MQLMHKCGFIYEEIKLNYHAICNLTMMHIHVSHHYRICVCMGRNNESASDCHVKIYIHMKCKEKQSERIKFNEDDVCLALIISVHSINARFT